jgi:RND family efflux transporter MFP subunit
MPAPRERTRHALRRRIVVCLAALVVAIPPACRREAPAENASDAAVPVTVAPARLADLADTLTASGTVVPATSSDQIVLATEPAEIAEAPKREGDTVAAGDLLVRFNVPAVTQEIAARQAEMAQATANLDRARRELTNVTSLWERGLVPRQSLDAAKAAVLDAQTVLTEARGRLDATQVLQARTIVKARFAGVVVKTWRVPGDFVTGRPDDPVLRVIDPTRTQVAVTLSRAELLRVTAGQPAAVRVAGGDAQPGSVSTRAPITDPNATSAELRVNVESATPLPLETVVEVVIVLDRRPNVVVVPRAALRRDEESSFVMIAGDDDRARRRSVQPGLVTSDLAQIVTGLTPGERVIVTGVEQVTDGSAITVNR